MELEQTVKTEVELPIFSEEMNIVISEGPFEGNKVGTLKVAELTPANAKILANKIRDHFLKKWERLFNEDLPF